MWSEQECSFGVMLCVCVCVLCLGVLTLEGVTGVCGDAFDDKGEGVTHSWLFEYGLAAEASPSTVVEFWENFCNRSVFC